MMKKFSLSLIVFLFLFVSGISGADAISKVDIFTSPGCPHCTTAKSFLVKLQDELQKNEGLFFEINDYDISLNIEKVKGLYQEYQVSSSRQGLVPAIFLGEKYFVGFNDQTADEIESYLLQKEFVDSDKNIVSLPFLGEVDLLSFSLPVLAVTLGIIDGFNVCSLGALIVILGLVIVLGSRKRIFLYGGVFLLTTSIIYGLLIFLWHQLFTFVAPYIKSMEVLIGVLALAGGIYLLREFYKAYKNGPICGSNNLMSRLVPKIQKLFKEKSNRLLLLLAVMIFAIIVTIIEFPCSAFLPVLFTSILVDSGISFGTSLLYIGLYMLMYLLDEIIIFVIAVVTLRIKIVSPKFIIFFNLLAALIFIALGLYYILGLL